MSRSGLTGTPAEVAEELNCGVGMVEALMDQGRLPFVKLGPRKRVISWAALEEWLAAESRASLNGHADPRIEDCPF